MRSLIKSPPAKLIPLLGAALMLACSGDPPPAPVTRMSATVGEVVTIALETTGYGHFEDPSISEPIVQLVSSTSARTEGGETLRQVYRFAVVASGLTEIRFGHTWSSQDTVVEITVSR
jgi:hypothetical protein